VSASALYRSNSGLRLAQRGKERLRPSINPTHSHKSFFQAGLKASLGRKGLLDWGNPGVPISWNAIYRFHSISLERLKDSPSPHEKIVGVPSRCIVREGVKNNSICPSASIGLCECRSASGLRFASRSEAKSYVLRQAGGLAKSDRTLHR